MDGEQIAREWIRTDPYAAHEDIRRLGLDTAAAYNLSLMASCIRDGDDRWQGVTLDDMREALQGLADD